jgi:hypothetical protein
VCAIFGPRQRQTAFSGFDPQGTRPAGQRRFPEHFLSRRKTADFHFGPVSRQEGGIQLLQTCTTELTSLKITFKVTAFGI